MATGLALGTVDAWVAWNLTGGPDGGVFATDPSNASRTLLFDIRSLSWSEELCDLFGVPRGASPRCGRPRAGSGCVDPDRAGGLTAPLSGIAGDQQAALFGQACFAPGMTKNTYGTGSFVLMNVGPNVPPPVEGLLTTVAWTLGDGTTAYALEGGDVRDRGGHPVAPGRAGHDRRGRRDRAALAASVPDAEGVFLVPAFTGLGSPYWDPHARGALLGLTRTVGRAHLARAAVEAMAHQTRDVVEAMEAIGGTVVCRAAGRRRGGGHGRALPVPGRPARRARPPPAGGRDDRAGRRLSGRPGRGRLVDARRPGPLLAARRRVHPDHGPQGRRPRARPPGAGPSKRPEPSGRSADPAEAGEDPQTLSPWGA